MRKLYRLSILCVAFMLFGSSAGIANASGWTDAQVGLAPTTVTVEDPNDPSRPGERVEVYIHVTSQAGTPTGVVQITGADTNCSVRLKNGMGSCQVVFRSLKKRVITASYLGNANFAPSAATAEHTMLRKTVFRSQGDLDGWILESHEASGQGGVPNSDSRYIIIGDDATDRQFRSILHFDTSSLPDQAIFQYAEVRVKRYGVRGQNPMASAALILDCKDDFFGKEASLVASDFEAPSTPSVIPMCSDFYSAGRGWFSATFFPSSLTISSTGTAQFRLSLWTGDNDDRDADQVWFYSGNAAFENRPQLVVWFSMP